jgi:hypothetical protein
MAELIVSALGLTATVVVGWFLGIIVSAFADDMGPGFLVSGTVLFLDSLLGLYFLVRFIHWCWVTPIPQMPFLPH